MRYVILAICAIAVAIWLPFALIPPGVKSDIRKLLAESDGTWGAAAGGKGILRVSAAAGADCGSARGNCGAASEREIRVMPSKGQGRILRTDRSGNAEAQLGKGPYRIEIRLRPGERTRDLPGYVFIQPGVTSEVRVRISEL